MGELVTLQTKTTATVHGQVENLLMHVGNYDLTFTAYKLVTKGIVPPNIGDPRENIMECLVLNMIHLINFYGNTAVLITLKSLKSKYIVELSNADKTGTDNQ